MSTKAHDLDLVVVTPERAVVRERVDEVVIPGAEGYMGVLPGHAPLFSQLQVGELSYKIDGGWTSLAVAWGFVEILNNQVRVMAETAERAHEIDVDRARRAKERAENRLSQGGENLDFTRALASLQRALIRLEISTKRRRT